MARDELRYSLLVGFAICQLPAGSAIPDWATHGEFFSISGSEEELSLVCEAKFVPKDVKMQACFVCLKLQGPFPLDETGVLCSFIQPLSNAGIPVFAIATYNTDYVFIPEEFWGVAHDALMAAGHIMV
ncbi:MAG TPA: ACT domain-containing protein [Terriglobales bacterium]